MADETLVPDEQKLDAAMNAIAKAVSDALRELPLATRLETLPRFVVVAAFPFHGMPGPALIRTIGNLKRADYARELLGLGQVQIDQGDGTVKIYGAGL